MLQAVQCWGLGVESGRSTNKLCSLRRMDHSVAEFTNRGHALSHKGIVMIAGFFRHMAVLGVVLATAPAALGSAQEPAVDRGVSIPLPATYEHRLRSRITQREYIVWVSLPPAYEANSGDVERRWPTLYLLDGRQSLQLALPMLRLTNRGTSGEVILVGLGYPLDARGLPSCGALLCRDVDYIPPPFGGPSPFNLPPGGADVFLRVLKEEIIPFVERRYRASADRGLFGHSQGGLFVMYALLEAPDLFGSYAASSLGGYNWDVEAMLRRERAFRERTPDLQKTVYLSVGSEDAPYFIVDTWRMIGALCDGMFNGTAYRGLTLLAAVQPNEVHQSPVHIARALGALYPRDTTSIPRPPTRDMSTHCRRT